MEFVRHRVFSFAQESTRFCNYSKDKFGNELTFIIPNWLELEEGHYYSEKDHPFVAYNAEPLTPEEFADYSQPTKDDATWGYLNALQTSEYMYLDLLKHGGWAAQQARSVLPNSLKTELVMTGFASDWQGFFRLRDTSPAHPQARELARPLHVDFINNKYYV